MTKKYRENDIRVKPVAGYLVGDLLDERGNLVIIIN